MSARECAERKRERRRAWRARRRSVAEFRRINARVNRQIAVEEERERRGVEYTLRMAEAITALSGVRSSPVDLPQRLQTFALRVRQSREVRAQVTVTKGDRLALRAEQLAAVPCVVLSSGPVQSTARVAIIVETSNTVFAVESDRYPIAWVYDGDSIDTYNRVRALRGAR